MQRTLSSSKGQNRGNGAGSIHPPLYSLISDSYRAPEKRHQTAITVRYGRATRPGSEAHRSGVGSQTRSAPFVPIR